MTKEEAIEKVREMKLSPGKDAELIIALHTLIPEFHESKDEKTRKSLLDYIKKESKRLDTKKWIAYLEKQKEQKEELVYRLNGLMQDYIKEGKDDEEKEHRLKCYRLFWDALEDTNFFEQKEQKSERINVKEMVAKYGATDEYVEGEYKGKPVNCMIRAYEQGIRDTLLKVKEQKPAEWSEVELEFRGEKVKVKRSFYRDDKGRGYSTAELDEEVAWNALRAWCEKKGISLYDLYPKAEWSEKDETIIEGACNALEIHGHTKLASMLKSLRPQSIQEWSEEDEKMYNSALWHIKNSCGNGGKNSGEFEVYQWFENRLKSLRPSWKLSEEKKKETLDGADVGYGLETAIDILENGFMHYQTDDGEYKRKQALDVLIFLLNETRKKEDAKLWSKDIVESIATWAKEKLQIYSMKESTPYVEAVKNNAQKVLDWAKEQWPIYFGWKPSEEQMDALIRCIAPLEHKYFCILSELYEQLKKL